MGKSSPPVLNEKFRYLINAEMALEGNYNMVGDGIINNVPKPSVLERLAEFEQRKKKRQKTDRINDKRERHRADFLDSKEKR